MDKFDFNNMAYKYAFLWDKYTTNGYGGDYQPRHGARGKMSPKKFRKKERNRPGQSR
jgi:hypothetical protein